MQKTGRQRLLESLHRLPLVLESSALPLEPQVPYFSARRTVLVVPSGIDCEIRELPWMRASGVAAVGLPKTL